MSEKRKPQVVTRGFVSERGPLKIKANPVLEQPNPDAPVNREATAAYYHHKELAEKYGEEAAADKIAEMAEAYRGGVTSTRLFSQPGPNGFILYHVWFGANFELFRHSHPGLGDCLYFVIAGELSLGKQRLGPGSTFFLPNGQPYKYVAGPAGVEVLEIRSGLGVEGEPYMHLHELSLEAIDKLIDCYKTNKDRWQAPKKVGDVAKLQMELDLGTN